MRFFILPILFLLIECNLAAQIISRSHLPVIPANGPGEIVKSDPVSDADIRNVYLASVSHQYEFVNGREFVPYFYRSKTSPFMFSGTPFISTLYFNGRIYHDISLQYDTYTDEAVFTDTTRMLHSELPRVALNKDLIEGFDFIFNRQSYKFRYLRAKTAAPGLPGDGYYDVAYEGPSEFLVKHRGMIYQKDAIDEYKYGDIKYILARNEFRKVTGLRDFLSLFGNRSREVKSFIQDRKIRFRKADKTEVAAVLEYYDSLTKQDKN
jgi:hypothetical protein